MKDAAKAAIGIVAVIVILLAVYLVIKPAYAITGKTPAELVQGDEIVLGNQSFFYQNQSPAPNNASLIRLVMLDSNNNEVQTTVSPTVPLPVKEPLEIWTVIPPAPPPPAAVSVPVPVPPPAASTPPPPVAPPPPTPAPSNATTPHAPLPPNATNMTPPMPSPSNATPPTPPPPNLTLPTPPPPNATPPTPPPPIPSPMCGNGILEGSEQCEPPNTPRCDAACQIIPYPAHCSNLIWDGDESDLDCGRNCPQCLSTGPYTYCWDNSDCASGNCNTTSATRPLPSGHTIQSLRQLAGQSWIIQYQGTCK